MLPSLHDGERSSSAADVCSSENSRPLAIDVFVGARIRMRRLELGLSYKELAAVIAVTDERVEAYESGTIRVRPGHLIDLADLLGVTLRFFFV